MPWMSDGCHVIFGPEVDVLKVLEEDIKRKPRDPYGLCELRLAPLDVLVMPKRDRFGWLRRLLRT